MNRRVLHVVGASSFGGGGIVIIDLARAAAATGYEVSVLTTDPVFQEKLATEGMRAVDIDVIRRPIRPLWDLFGLWRLWRYLRQERYDIVHTHTSKGGFVGRFAARMAGVPVIIHTVHGFAFHGHSSRTETLSYVALERIAAKACDLIVTVSEHHLEQAISRGIGTHAQLVAIPNGLDPSRVSAACPRETIRASLGLPPEFVVLVTIARLNEAKGIDYALEAIASLDRDTRRRIRLLIAGDGPLAGHLAAKASDLRLGDTVEFLGFRDDVGDLLAASDLVVMPSLWEGLSISLLEAMAAHKAIIATTIPSNLEVASDCAVLVPPANVAALAEAIASLVANPGRRADLAQRAGEHFASLYTISRMTDEYLHQYSRLLESKLGDQGGSPPIDATPS